MIDYSFAKRASNPPVLNPGVYPPITSFVAVTSVSPHPHAHIRQQRALESWTRFGLSILAVNTRDEVHSLRSLYPMVNQWNELPGHHEHVGKQKVWDLLQSATLLNKPILLLNSDIVIEGEQEDLINQIDNEHALVGIRSNVRNGTVTREVWGFDVFYVTPLMAANFPMLDWFLMGKPGWDYWLPLHFLVHKIPARYIADRLFFHHCHTKRWSRDENQHSLKRLADYYGRRNLNKLRYRLPYPPGSDK